MNCCYLYDAMFSMYLPSHFVAAEMGGGVEIRFEPMFILYILRFSQCSELHVFRTIQFEPFVRKLSQFFVNLEKESEILSTDIEVKCFETWYERKYLIYCFIACNKNRNIKHFTWAEIWNIRRAEVPSDFSRIRINLHLLKIADPDHAV